MARLTGCIFSSDSLQNDVNQPQISANGPIPTGITTPQPELSDKRQPPFMQNHLQVGYSGPKSTASSFHLPDTMAAADNPQSDALLEARDGQGSSARSSISSESLVMMGGGAKSAVPSDNNNLQALGTQPKVLSPAKLPTPPYCSTHSLLQKETDEMDTASSTSDKDMGSSIVNALRSYLPAPPGTATVSKPAARRQTSHPVSSISENTVLASHFSNPCLPSLCTSEQQLASAQDHDNKPLPRVSMSSENLAKLTLNDVSRLKNTPPLTPRAMSSDGSQSEKKPATSAADESSQSENPAPTTATTETTGTTATDEMKNETEEITGKLNEAFPSENSTRSSSPQSNPPVGSLKGKLFVTIREARGLRPGFDPYVVCVFESNEVISKSAHDEEEASIERQKKEQEKSDLEAGRPIAIPMKSRQSSSNSLPSLLDEQKAKALMTDPHWNHETVLYVFSRALPAPPLPHPHPSPHFRWDAA